MYYVQVISTVWHVSWNALTNATTRATLTYDYPTDFCDIQRFAAFNKPVTKYMLSKIAKFLSPRFFYIL